MPNTLQVPEVSEPEPSAGKFLLFGPDEGWSLEPIAMWLSTEGRKLLDPAVLLTELMARLDEVGHASTAFAYPAAACIRSLWRRWAWCGADS
jgi:hypothetical protein